MKNSAGKKICRRFYGHGIPGVKPGELAGKLIVIEGADGSGRSTQIARLVEWLETCGHATVPVSYTHLFMVMDANQHIEKQQVLVRKLVSEKISLAKFKRRSPLPLPPAVPADEKTVENGEDVAA